MLQDPRIAAVAETLQIREQQQAAGHVSQELPVPGRDGARDHVTGLGKQLIPGGEPCGGGR